VQTVDIKKHNGVLLFDPGVFFGLIITSDSITSVLLLVC